MFFQPLGSLYADHAHVFSVVYQCAAEALVLERCLNVTPVMLGHTTSCGQVVRITLQTHIQSEVNMNL